MSEHEIKPLESELQALLDVERSPPDLPRDVAARVLQRVEATAAFGAASGEHGAAVGGGLGGGLLARRLPFGMVMFVLGGLAGAGLHATLQPSVRPPAAAPRAPLLPVSPVSGATEPAPLAPVVPPPRAEVPEPVPLVRPAPVPATVPVPSVAYAAREPTGPGRDVDLAAERALLEIARTALARGQVEAALDAVQRHARRFPRGQLVEERESVWIQALVAGERSAEARQRAAEFRRRFPQSILRPVVEAAVRSIP